MINKIIWQFSNLLANIIYIYISHFISTNYLFLSSHPSSVFNNHFLSLLSILFQLITSSQVKFYLNSFANIFIPYFIPINHFFSLISNKKRAQSWFKALHVRNVQMFGIVADIGGSLFLHFTNTGSHEPAANDLYRGREGKSSLREGIRHSLLS